MTQMGIQDDLHVSNRILLCGPCNRAKSNTYALGSMQ